MNNIKKIIIAVIVAVGAILIFIFQHGLYNQPVSQNINSLQQTTNKPQPANSNEEPKVVSTKPDSLDGSTILPNQVIEITFNRPLENVGEFKNRIDPKSDISIKLSNDRKTAIITPQKPYALGGGFTLFILPDSKFDGKKTLGKDIIFHFNTIGYKGV